MRRRPMSLSSWRAWIEIARQWTWADTRCSRSPHGERGLKYASPDFIDGQTGGRSPHGERGLKSKRIGGWCRPRRWSLSSWRAWIEIETYWWMVPSAPSRSPHGERGLKFDDTGHLREHDMSLSSWRAWIEIAQPCSTRIPRHAGRSPHGERGLKLEADHRQGCERRRSPHGERGLKSDVASP